MTAIYMSICPEYTYSTSTWCNISTFTTLRYISQPANLHLTIQQNKKYISCRKNPRYHSAPTNLHQENGPWCV